jgi:DNA-binding CsgD family transcriptional regulator
MDRVAELRAHRFVRVVAPAGYGKTTLLRAVLGAARESGWLALSVSCGAVAQADPLALLLDVTSAAFRELGDQAGAYASGLNRALGILRPSSEPEPAARAVREVATVPPEIVVSRLLEGVGADRRLLIAIDDAHLLATETARAIRYVYAYLSDVPLCLICAQRDDAPPHADLPPCSAELVLGPLADADAHAIARAEYPGAPNDVLAALVDQARGSPADVVVLASQARADEAMSATDVSSTLHAKVARELAALDDETRTFLQYCALIGAPIEQRILNALYADAGRLAWLIERARRYLLAHDGSFAFRHAVMPTAIRETIALELPLRRKIIAAFAQPDRGAVADYERIVDHAAAIGDRDVCYDYTTRIAEAAYALERWEQSVTAFAGALALRWPPPERYVEFFRRYASALRGAIRDAEAEAIVVRALRHAAETGLGGVGRLAATLVALQTELEEPARAIATFDRSIRDARGADEISELRAAIAATYAGSVDEPHFDAVAAQLHGDRAATPIAVASLHQSEALLHARLGRHDAARAALRIAESFATSQQSGLDFSLPLIGLFVDFQEHGCRALGAGEPRSGTVSRGEEIVGYWHYLHAVCDVARGRWQAVQSRLERINLERLPAVQQMLLLATAAATEALGEQRLDAAAPAVTFLDVASRRGIGSSAFQLAAWVLAAKRELREITPAITRQVRAFHRRPLAIDLICFAPVALALHAVHADAELAAELAAEPIPPCSRWLHAQFAFSRGYTRLRLGLDDGQAQLRAAADEFASVGASFFAELAAGCAASDAGARRPARRREDGLTARELQIAELVAGGKRNREIAQALFLSERTVEVHLANAYAKLNLSSRTQLARYMLG